MSTLFKGTFGLKTTDNPIRLIDGRSKKYPGIVELATAKNVYVDDALMVWRRKGYSLLDSGDFHSAFCAGGDCFVVQERTNDAAIMSVTPGAVNTVILEGVRSGLSKGARMSWTQVNADTFYSNGKENGFIRGGVSFPWPVGEYVGPETDKQFSAAPVGRHIAFKPGGWMFVAVGDVLTVNHKPFEFGLFHRHSGVVQFESDILMVCPVRAGVFVSDCRCTWFLRGNSVFDFTQELVADYPAVEWSLAHDHIDVARDLGFDKLTGKARIWASNEGICAGLDDGSMINLTNEKITLGGSYLSGASVICKRHKACRNQIISTLKA